MVVNYGALGHPKIMDIDTKAIRTKLMLARRSENKSQEANSGYYDGVLDALFEVEKLNVPQPA